MGWEWVKVGLPSAGSFSVSAAKEGRACSRACHACSRGWDSCRGCLETLRKRSTLKKTEMSVWPIEHQRDRQMI